MINEDILIEINSHTNIGDLFKMLKLANNYTSKDIGDALLISRAYISSIEKSNRTMSIRLLRDYLKYCLVTPQQFLKIISFYEHFKGDRKYTFTFLEVLKVITYNSQNMTEFNLEYN